MAAKYAVAKTAQFDSLRTALPGKAAEKNASRGASSRVVLGLLLSRSAISEGLKQS